MRLREAKRAKGTSTQVRMALKALTHPPNVPYKITRLRTGSKCENATKDNEF
jgi:hypothetical protein